MLESKAFSEKVLKIFKICAVKWILEGVGIWFYMLTDRYLCVNDELHH